ncbi:chorismate synthase [Candidatus Micrarchaeota archaeon]|nr:chorismate synthase [Candidatus Micrarchaeota archaeon]
MNTFGRLFRVSIFGESHGDGVGIVIDGCPAGLDISKDDFAKDLERRKGGSRNTTARKEADIPMIKSGVFNGKSTGAPIMIFFENKEVDSSDYERIKNTPRPGHADLVAMQKFKGFNDYRGGGHFSGRLTVALVAAGVIAKKILNNVKIKAELMGQEIEELEGDSIGGIVECIVTGLPVGLGEPFFDSAESLLSHAAFSIPAIKGIEFGAGFACAKMRGSEFSDEIIDIKGTTKTNNAGGINGGITNGNELVFRVAVKPASSINKPMNTVDVKTKEQVSLETRGRHDACIALRVPVVLEAITAIVLADLMLIDQR